MPQRKFVRDAVMDAFGPRGRNALDAKNFEDTSPSENRERIRKLQEKEAKQPDGGKDWDRLVHGEGWGG